MKKNWYYIVIIVLLVVGFLGILPRAFDMTWTFWSKESAAKVPAAEVPVAEVPATEVPATEVPATEVPATEVPATEVPAAEEAKMPLLDCGEFGSYQAIPVGNNWEYWMQEPLKITGLYGLVDLKIKGGECKFSIPNGYIAIWNQSAGTVYINGAKGNLGNPVKLNGSELLTGDILSSWGAKNDSAGVMITLIPE